eukprot:3039382-Prymnesium_polylepis.2
MQRVKPVIDEGSEAVANQVGAEAWQVEASVVVFGGFFVSMVMYGFVYVPINRLRNRQRQNQLVAAFERMEAKRKKTQSAQRRYGDPEVDEECTAVLRPRV